MLPELDGVDGVRVDSLGANHMVLKSNGDMPLRIGDKFQLISGQQDIMVNRWDQFIGVRNGKVEAVWDITARGCHN